MAGHLRESRMIPTPPASNAPGTDINEASAPSAVKGLPHPGRRRIRTPTVRKPNPRNPAPMTPNRDFRADIIAQPPAKGIYARDFR